MSCPIIDLILFQKCQLNGVELPCGSVLHVEPADLGYGKKKTKNGHKKDAVSDSGTSDSGNVGGSGTKEKVDTNIFQEKEMHMERKQNGAGDAGSGGSGNCGGADIAEAGVEQGQNQDTRTGATDADAGEDADDEDLDEFFASL